MKIPTIDFQKEVDYCAVASIAKSLLQQGHIIEKEYNKINVGFIKNYHTDFKFAGGVPDNSQASIAQEESRGISQNVTWGKNREMGKKHRADQIFR